MAGLVAGLVSLRPTMAGLVAGLVSLRPTMASLPIMFPDRSGWTCKPEF